MKIHALKFIMESTFSPFLTRNFTSRGCSTR